MSIARDTGGSRRPHLEGGQLVDQRVADGLDLGGDDRQHRRVDPVELIEAAPRATLGEAREDLPDGLGNPIRSVRACSSWKWGACVF